MTATTKERRCRWTDLPLPDDQPRVRVHPAFRRATMHWSRAQRQQYAELVRQLGTLDHPQLQALRQQTWRDIHDARAAHLDRAQRRSLDLALERDGTE
jgi:hypothetical protein